MQINADFSEPACVLPDEYEWRSSPQPGVDRVMLDRIGEEKARATSIVRYAPESYFPTHSHPGGEEILVLSGTFSERNLTQDDSCKPKNGLSPEDHRNSEDTCHYSAGWYLRSPPGSSHRPFSGEGAVIFVKLWQMGADETQMVRLNTNDPANWVSEPQRVYCQLYIGSRENVQLTRLHAGASLFTKAIEGAEILVLEGGLNDASTFYPAGAWVRLPAGRYPSIVAGETGAKCYVKTGRLGGPNAQ
jgi:anti-sigma factor ChrR (cupin superfamily)